MGNCFSCFGQKNKNYKKCLEDEIPICEVIVSKGENDDAEACIDIKDQTSQQTAQYPQSQVSSTSLLQHNSSGANHSAQNFPLADNLQRKAKTALIYPTLPHVPGSLPKRTTKDWQWSVSQALRHHSVQKIVQASFPTTDLATLHDNAMIGLIDYAQKIEEGMFSAANNQAEYCQLVDEKVRKIQKEIEDKKQKRRELAQQRGQVGGPITPMIGNNATASTNLTTFPASVFSHHYDEGLERMEDIINRKEMLSGMPLPLISSVPTSQYNPSAPFQIPPLPSIDPYHSRPSTVPPFPSTSLSHHSLLPPLYSPYSSPFSTLPDLRRPSLNSEYSQSNIQSVSIPDYQSFYNPHSSFLPTLPTVPMLPTTHSTLTYESERSNYNPYRSSKSLNGRKESRDNTFSYVSGYGSSSKPVEKASSRSETKNETNLNSESSSLSSFNWQKPSQSQIPNVSSQRKLESMLPFLPRYGLSSHDRLPYTSNWDASKLLQEEEDLQLAIALSQSEAEINEDSTATMPTASNAQNSHKKGYLDLSLSRLSQLNLHPQASDVETKQRNEQSMKAVKGRLQHEKYVIDKLIETGQAESLSSLCKSKSSQSHNPNVPIQSSPPVVKYSEPSCLTSNLLGSMYEPLSNTIHYPPYPTSSIWSNETKSSSYDLLSGSGAFGFDKRHDANNFSASSKPLEKENLSAELDALRQTNLKKLEEKESMARSLPANYQKPRMGLFQENSRSTTSDNFTQELGSPLQNPTASVPIHNFWLKDWQK